MACSSNPEIVHLLRVSCPLYLHIWMIFPLTQLDGINSLKESYEHFSRQFRAFALVTPFTQILTHFFLSAFLTALTPCKRRRNRADCRTRLNNGSYNSFTTAISSPSATFFLLIEPPTWPLKTSSSICPLHSLRTISRESSTPRAL